MSKQFAEFLVDELFEWDNGSRLNTDERISGRIPFFTAGSENRGLYGYISNNAGTFHKPITIDMFGNCFYHPFEKCYGDDNVYFLERECSDRIKLYVCTAISKTIQKLFSYATQFRKEQLRQLRIELPVTDATANTPNPEPDWGYMEDYIKTIEQKFIDQIAECNSKEQEILEQLHPESVNTKPEAHGFEDVPLKSIFTPIKSTAKVKNFEKETIETKTCTLPGLSATNTNNGFGFYLNENEHAPLNNCITVSANGINTGYAAYQGGNFGIAQDAYALKFKDEVGAKRHYLYFTGVLNKNNELRYDYTRKAGWRRLSQDFVKVPVTSTGDIDWDYMERYIAWIEERERESRALRAAREEQILTWLHQYR